MALKWTDTLDIAIELDETHPDADPMHVNFVDLRNWVMALEEFDDDPEHCGERILEAIQMAWMEERDGRQHRVLHGMHSLFHLTEGSWQEHKISLSFGRCQVFVGEQQVPKALELDEHDPHCHHVLVCDSHG